MMLYIDMLSVVLALNIFWQCDIGLIIAIQDHAIDGWRYYLEIIKDALKPDGFLCYVS